MSSGLPSPIVFDDKTIGKVTEAVAEKNLAKAAGVIAGAVVGTAAALAGLGPGAPVAMALTAKLTERFFGRLSAPNTANMLAAYRTYGEKQVFIGGIVETCTTNLKAELKPIVESIDGLALDNEAQFHQLIKFLGHNVVDVLEAGHDRILEKTDAILAEIRGNRPALFASASDEGITVIPPNLDRAVKLPDHLKDYLQRRLGIIKQRVKFGDKDDRKSSPPRDHDTWRESIRQHEVEYEDQPEDQILRQLVAAASQASPRKLWVIQGEPGAGKSALIEHWVERWVAGLETEPNDGMLLPILVRFRDLPEICLPASGSELAEVLWSHAYVGELGTRYPKIYAESRQVKVVPVWLLDGWDEARLDEYRTDGFLNKLHRLPGLKLLTCRTAVLANIRQPSKLDTHFQPNRIFTLRDLDQQEQLRFLNVRLPTHPIKSKNFHLTLQKHAQLRAISGSPLLLGLMADMAGIEFARGSEVHLPGSRSSFYRRAIEHAWAEKLRGQAVADEDAILRDDVLQGLADRMGLANITIDSRTVIELMKAFPDLQTRELRERLLDFLVRSGMVRSPQTGVYEFVHLTFQEYYLARRLRQDGLKEALYKYWANPRYDESLALLVSQLVEAGEALTVEGVLVEFVAWGQEKYDDQPDYLLETVKRSPLLLAIHLVNRAGISARSMVRLMEDLTERVCRSSERKTSVSLDRCVFRPS